MGNRDQIVAWSDIAGRFNDVLLIGNGASRAVTESFKYESLLGIAEALGEGRALSPADREVFEYLNETDFERVLAEIDRAAALAELAGIKDASPLRDQYGRIRESLISAVHQVHPRHSILSKDRLLSVQDALLHFKTVYTTNYDLLLYWAVTSSPDKMENFRDFFWNLPGLWFDPADTWTGPGKTRVLYLHGGLHLFALPDGSTVKASGGSNDPWKTYEPLLDLTFTYQGARYPLFVSEGSWQKKIAAISSNAYLTFAYLDWVEHAWNWRESLVVFGHSLGPGDEHLVRPLRSQATKAEEEGWTCPPVAVSLVVGDEDSNTKRIDRYRRRLARDDLIFFDATTHPLGRPAE